MDEKGWSQFHPKAAEFLDAIPASAVEEAVWMSEETRGYEAMTIPAQVNYVGKAASLYAAGYRFHGSCHVISRYLRNAWLWEKVRVQGGAYGAFTLFDRISGVLTFVSYRDPNLMRTLEIFDGSAEFLKNLRLSDKELSKSIIGTIGDMDQYQLPDAKGYTSLVRHLAGETDVERQRIREEVLATNPSDFTSFGVVLEQALNRGETKVLGSETAIKEALAERPGWLEVLKVL